MFNIIPILTMQKNVLNKNYVYFKGEKNIMAMSENSKIVFGYVKEHDGENITAADIADGTGLAIRSVNGIVTSAFQRKGLMVRTPAEIEVTDDEGKATHKPVKFISLTDEGRAFDPDAVEEKAAVEEDK